MVWAKLPQHSVHIKYSFPKLSVYFHLNVMYFAQTLARAHPEKHSWMYLFLSVSMSGVFWQFYLLIFVHGLCTWLTKIKLNASRIGCILDELINVSRSKKRELRRKPLNTEYTIYHCSHIVKFNRFFSPYGGELSHHKNRTFNWVNEHSFAIFNLP